ncbi:MAG TPA: 30S ribosomal protein S3 [Candidatus Paceibacterota bacterium]|nr:30S ribosomal protein S3 [Candidatus Paceibacterota bacterium]
MAQYTNPKSLRTGITKEWDSRWLNLKKMPQLLKEDQAIRELILKGGKELRIEKIEIERKLDNIKIVIHTARPGLLIGRQGQGINNIEKAIAKLLRKQAKDNKSEKKTNYKISVSVEEVRRPETSAQIMAQNIAEDIEKRIPYRLTMKRNLARIIQHKNVGGAKIMISGRLDGNEIARDEWLQEGKLPQQTLRADIDYGFAEAYCTYGVVGVKVWIYKLPEEEKNK